MAYLFTVLFQGEMTTQANVDPAQRREVERRAFPSTPPRDAASRESFRAYKIAPLESGQVLLATSVGGGRDPFGREVLRATGCVLDTSQLTGALRDLSAVWRVLGEVDLREDVEGQDVEGQDVEGWNFERLWNRVHAGSLAAAPDAFQLFQAALERDAPFYARLADVLNGDQVDLYLGSGDALDLIRPALGLLPLPRIQRLHLVLGGELSEYREAAVGVAEKAPSGLVHGQQGLLGKVLQLRSKEPVSVDFDGRQVYGALSDGPLELARAITDPRPWPDGLTDLPRYKVLLQCIDASRKGRGAPTPFDFRPDLAELRQSVQDLENLSAKLVRWR